MRVKDINGKYVSNAIGYCHCPTHPGALTRQQGYKHKCIGKKCKYLEKTNDKAWQVQRYFNSNHKGKN